FGEGAAGDVETAQSLLGGQAGCDQAGAQRLVGFDGGIAERAVLDVDSALLVVDDPEAAVRVGSGNETKHLFQREYFEGSAQRHVLLLWQTSPVMHDSVSRGPGLRSFVPLW